MSFGPLFRHLPITLEDDAVIRDEQFERMELERMRAADQENGDVNDPDSPHESALQQNIEMKRLSRTTSAPDAEDQATHSRFDPRVGLNHAMTWANKRSRAVEKMTGTDAIRARHRRKLKDLEKQQAELSGAFFSGNDELEDLSPHQRDALVKEAFRHSALRENQPAVWIPRDDLGVSDDEIARTVQFSQHIWLSNAGAGLDSKVRVIFQQNPPDFSEVEHIRL
jgi:hypothetical protein